MELRSRSRSNTPLIKETEKRESFSQVTRKSQRLLRSQKKRYITSDYSSEEGETVSDNTKNLIREEMAHSSTVNGNGEVSALKLYKEAGEYWNKYPKTDYTYSKHSKDRVELAPGVVVMPNMSRRSLHTTFSDGIVSHKETSTEEQEFYKMEKKLKPQVLFSNNNNNKHEQSSRVTVFFRRIVFVYVLNLLRIVFFPVFYIYEKQQALILTIGKVLHRVASRIMLWDTWILQKKVFSDRKLYGVLSLCLLPLLLFGGFWFLHAIIAGITSWMSTLPLQPQSTLKVEEIPVNLINNKPINLNLNHINQLNDRSQKEESKIVYYDDNFKAKVIKFIEEMEIFKKSLENLPEDVANQLIKMNKEKLFCSQQNNHNNEFTKGFNDEIKNIKEGNLIIQEEIAKINNLRALDLKKTDILSGELKKCCRRSILDERKFENYIMTTLNDLFGVNKDQKITRDDLTKFLKTIFVAKDDLEMKIEELTKDLQSNLNPVISNNVKILMDEAGSKIKTEIIKDLNQNEIVIPTQSKDISEDRVKRIVSESLAIYDADKTGLVDYAMESAGGYIISTRCTQIYQPKTAVLSIFGVPIWYPSNTPRTVITPGSNPGQCWAFQNFPGFLVIKLFGFVKISSFSMEHVSKKLAPNENIASAPKDFEVYGLRSEDDMDPVLLGSFQYLNDGNPLQFFMVEGKNDGVFELVELKVLSNHGNPNYTCLYRFRVHGELITS